MIVFVSDEETDKVETVDDQAADEQTLHAYDRYVKERLQDTAYLSIMIGLRRLRRSLGRIKGSWQGASRSQTIGELDNLLLKQQELELKIERIEDVFVREYVYGQLDQAASARRHLAEEVKWDAEAYRNAQRQVM